MRGRRRTLHRAGLFGLALEGDGREHVDEDLEPEDLDRQERLVVAGERGDEDEPEHRHVRRDQEDQALLDVGHETPTLAQAVHQGHERVVAQDHVRGLAGNRRAASHGHRDVRVVERGSVVHSVAGDRDGAVRAAGPRPRSVASAPEWPGPRC